ncbi:MAG: tRNA (adenosine(37)-N6)-threonylcarbamoyltransferase complex dimerization subunit type 1 TsaB [Bacteroidota bacterium]
MAPILSIETSTTVCSVAIHDDGKIKASSTYYIDKSHSTVLIPTIDTLIIRSGYDKSDLSAVALSKGPGSYTGLRIGTSTAKGLCFALDIPLIAVGTLEGLAKQVAPFLDLDVRLCPMLDARRMEVYTCILDNDLSVVKDVHPAIIDDTSFKKELDGSKVVFFGNGAHKCREVIKHQNAIFIDGIEPSAEEIGYLAYTKFQESAFEDLAYFEPFYLKEFRATVPKARI